MVDMAVVMKEAAVPGVHLILVMEVLIAIKMMVILMDVHIVQIRVMEVGMANKVLPVWNEMKLVVWQVEAAMHHMMAIMEAMVMAVVLAHKARVHHHVQMETDVQVHKVHHVQTEAAALHKALVHAAMVAMEDRGLLQ